MEFSLSLIFWLASGLGDLWQVLEKTGWNLEPANDVMKSNSFQNELGGWKMYKILKFIRLEIATLGGILQGKNSNRAVQIKAIPIRIDGRRSTVPSNQPHKF
jgi:hypothetical protein